MKQILLTAAAVLAFAALAMAQSQPAPPARTQAPTTTAPAQTAPPPSTAVKGLKPPPQAKTQEEYNAFMAAAQLAYGNDTAAADAAARDFKVKFPNSELTSQIYMGLMLNSIRMNNSERAVDMGREVLNLDPSNPVAAVYTSLVLAETTRETDIDAAQKFEEANKDANIGLQNVETNLMLAGSVPQETVDATKIDLKSRAYDTLGLVAFKRNDFTTAEKYFRQSIQMRGEPQDAMSHLRLALALDKQNKYKDALPEAQKAASLADPQDSVAKSAQAEVERLQKLTGTGGSAAVPPNQPPASPTPR